MEAYNDEVGVADLAVLAHESAARGPIWTRQSADLNVNLLVFDADDGVVEHVNDEVDVLLVGVAGAGVIVVEGTDHLMWAGQALVIPKGARRAIRGTGERFAYLSCHRRRTALWPAGVPRPDEGSVRTQNTRPVAASFPHLVLHHTTTNRGNNLFCHTDLKGMLSLLTAVLPVYRVVF